MPSAGGIKKGSFNKSYPSKYSSFDFRLYFSKVPPFAFEILYNAKIEGYLFCYLNANRDFHHPEQREGLAIRKSDIFYIN